MENVCGIFENKLTAENAMVELLTAGLDQSQISILISGESRDKEMVIGRDEAGEASKGAVVGAALGGAYATLVAGAVAVGSLAVPGSTLFVAGPLVAAFAGGAAGAVTGGLIGALAKAGIPEAEAKKFAGEIESGRAVMVVHPETDQQASLARSIILSTGSLAAAA